MPTINDKKYLNLQEQVLKNKNDIAAIIEGNIVLGELGIKVVGRVNTVGEIPIPETYTGEYGDAYLVGYYAPYDYYIFTRPFYGQTTPQWFNLGEFPVPGPQGEAGIGITPNITIGSVIDGDEAAVSITGTATNPVLNFVIPRGRPGENGRNGVSCTHEWIGTTLYVTSASGTTYADLRGPQGEAETPVKIVGELSSVDSLPEASEANREKGYLVTIGGVYYLYILVGEENAALTWTNVGPLAGSAGTEITVGGVTVTQWDADTKLDKSTFANSLYGVTGPGEQTQYPVDVELIFPLSEGNMSAEANNIVRRNRRGGITVPDTTNDMDAVSKQYLSSQFAIEKLSFLKEVYPVGSIYISMNNTSPATLFRFGTWTPITGKFLVGVDENDQPFHYAGITGGSKDAVVVSHTHTLIMTYDNEGTANSTLARDLYTVGTEYNNQFSIQSTGEDGTDKNLPPYFAVYMWRRES